MGAARALLRMLRTEVTSGSGPHARRRSVAGVVALGLLLAGCGRGAATARSTGSPAVPSAVPTAAPSPVRSLAPSPSPSRHRYVDPGTLPQTPGLPSGTSRKFRARMAVLWRGIVTDSPATAMPAFFPLAAYLQLKAIPGADADYRYRLVYDFGLDVRAAHDLLGAGAAHARLLFVSVPHQGAWIPPGYCENRIGYWHAPGSRLVYEEGGRVRSFGVSSFISWRGEWYVIHLAVNGDAGTVEDPSLGRGVYGPPGSC